MRTMAARLLLALAVLMNATASFAVEPQIDVRDVDLFYRLYDAAGGKPSAQQLQKDYLDQGSPGLKTLAQRRGVTGERIAESLSKHPALYADARRCAKVLPAVHDRLSAALRKLFDLYPEARNAPVTIAVGRGKPVGIGYPDSGVQIGLEALCAANFIHPDVEDRFVYVISHEYIHVQQNPSLVEGAGKQPTVLETSLLEGAADLVGELISGGIPLSYSKSAIEGREKQIETAFVADMDKTDLSDWVYNSTPEQPRDLGYWVGYRICKAYYQRATDKRQALRELLQASDARAVLAKSGWTPGMNLQ